MSNRDENREYLAHRLEAEGGVITTAAGSQPQRQEPSLTRNPL